MRKLFSVLHESCRMKVIKVINLIKPE